MTERQTQTESRYKVKQHDMSVHERVAGQYDKEYLVPVVKKVYDFYVLEDLMRFLKRTGYTLDYGGGTGRVSFFCGSRGFHMVCADLSRDMLAVCKVRCRKLSNVDLVRCDGELLPFRDGVFSNVVSFGTLHHLPNLKQAFGEIYRVLSYGGVFAAREPCMRGGKGVTYGKNARLVSLYYSMCGVVPRIFGVFNVIFRRPKGIEESEFERPLDPRLVSSLLVQLGFRVVNLRFVMFSVNPLVSLFDNERLFRMLLKIDNEIYGRQVFSVGPIMIALFQRE